MRLNLTKAEVEALRLITDASRFDWSCFGGLATTRAMVTLAAKLNAEPTRGAAVGPLEESLVKAAGGKVVPLVTGHARASRQAALAGATVDDARRVGAWMLRQGWLRGPQTLLDVLAKWPQWLSKATATEPPPSLPQGFDGGTGQGTLASGPGPAPGRAKSGFR